MPSWSGSALKKRGIPFVVAGNSNCRQSHEILGVINQTETLDATDALLGSPTTDYSGTQGRLWGPSDEVPDSFSISGDQKRLDFSARATGGQDQLRVLLAFGVPDEEQTLAYTVTEIELPDDLFGFRVNDVNNIGAWVGAWNVEPGGLLWLPEPAYGKGAGLHLLEHPDGTVWPSAINDSGQIVAFLDEPGHSTQDRVVIWQNGSFSDLASVNELCGISVWDINNAGQAVGGGLFGNCESGDPTFEPYIISGGGPTPLGTPGGFWGEAVDLNELGQAVGYEDSDPRSYLFWENGPGSARALTDLAAQPARLFLNDRGQIMAGGGKTWLWEDGLSTEIPGFRVFDFSDFGAVGTTRNGPFDVASLWVDGKIFTLNDLIITRGVVLGAPARISNNGHIVMVFGGPNWGAQVLTPVN